MSVPVPRAPLAVAVRVVVLLSLLSACTSSGSSGEVPVAGLPSDGVIAFATQNRGQVVVTRPDRTDVKELVSGSACCTTLSGDGGRLAFLTQTPDGRETVATMTVDGQDRFVIPPPAGLGLVPGVWAVDGTHLWLAGVATKPGGNGVVRSGPHGEDLTWLTHPPGTMFDLPVAASPDGTRVLFLRVPSSDADPFAGDLYVVPTSGGDPIRLNPRGTRVWYYWIRPGNFFPDSKHVTFAAASGSDDHPLGRVMVATVDGSSVEPVPMGPAAPSVGTAWTLTSQISPDGQWIAFDMWAPLATSVGRQGNSLFVVHPDGSGLRQLDTSPATSFGGVWSPDGSRVLYTVGGNQATNLRWVAVDGSGSGDVTTSGGEVFLDYAWAGGREPAPA